jgi:hypothetical protein
MQYDLIKTFQIETIENMKRCKYSLNLDESTCNFHHVLSVLVSYFGESEVVVEHLASLSLIKVDSLIFNELDKFFTDKAYNKILFVSPFRPTNQNRRDPKNFIALYMIKFLKIFFSFVLCMNFVNISNNVDIIH